MTANESQTFNEPFRPRARLLQLLGDQLIGSPRLALFELVKNAYDADASRVTVTMKDLGRPEVAEISVRDDGVGMSVSTLRDIWLVPGHDHKATMRKENRRTLKGRLPLGEKGVGRFAVHKLGNKVEIVSREAGAIECVLSIDWSEIANAEFLDEVKIQIDTRVPRVFLGDDHGTRVHVTHLRGEEWTRGSVRRLARQVTSISSPFVDDRADFLTQIEVPDQPAWLKDLPDTQSLIKHATWQFDFAIQDNVFTWMYKFNGVPGVKLEPRTVNGQEFGLLLNPSDLAEIDRPSRVEGKPKPKAVRSTSALRDGIGKISGRLYVFDRDKDVLAKIGYSHSLQTFLDESGGVRVYRDGMRVYNYGEAGDDWLGLDLRRVNSPTKRISNNIVVGSVELDLAESTDLTEKTNREGFVENLALTRFKALILGTVAVFEAERNKDKRELRKLLTKDRSSLGGGIEKPLQEISTFAKQNGLGSDIDPLVQKAQRAYDDMREIMLRAGVSGMSLVIVYHEIDHGVRLLQKLVAKGENSEKVVQHARDLVGVLDSFGDLIKKGASTQHDLGLVARRVTELNSVRLSNHEIELRIDSNGAEDGLSLLAELPLGLVLGAITNLIDNSIYWMSARWSSQAALGQKKLYIRVDADAFPEGPSIIIADNGPGFVDDLSDAVEPFFTRRPDGIGVGLYYAKLIMQTIGGRLREVTREDVPLPDEYDGAALALTFRRA
ncbi:ATP-binding protein [Leifsonia sp. A12D58]|uniref:ATP-binding protein n=1 Tax=Leifsonia sp. A12D58 TaxID=3397674 RepID=UPI0039DFD6C8